MSNAMKEKLRAIKKALASMEVLDIRNGFSMISFDVERIDIRW